MGWFGALFEGGKNKKEAAVEKKSSAPSSVSPEKRMSAIRDVARAGQQDVATRQAKAREIVASLQNRGIQTNRLETIASQGKEFEKFFSESGTQVDTESQFSDSETIVEEVVEKPMQPNTELPKSSFVHSENPAVINGPETVRTSKIEGLVAAHDDEESFDNVISLDQKRAEKKEADNEDPVKLREIAKEKTREIIDKEMTLRQLLKKGETPLSKKLQEEIAAMRAVNSELFAKIVRLEREQKSEKTSLDKAA